MAQDPNPAGELPKAYEPGKVEPKWYDFWMERGYFTPRIEPEKQPFVIIMPPPNITGELHLGHALTATLEDIMVRWHRMRGEPALWLPGVDHAGIATQVVLERALAREGLTRQQLGREEFLRRMKQWAERYRGAITRQHRRLGVSCDWSRERFTLDEGPSRAVRTAFVRLYEKGLIYRGERIINWCPRCLTALSDLEVDHADAPGNLYYVRYPAADGGEGITVATTRPETIPGDTAVAVNPHDQRYRGLVGKKVVVPIVNREVPVIADEAVTAEFGTGALKITPAHDPVDFEVGQRHGLEIICAISPDATMNEYAGTYRGMERDACRQAILADIAQAGLLVKAEPYQHSIGQCQRCHTSVEPSISRQWFVNTAPLAGPAIRAVADGEIRIFPERFVKVYLNWMANIRDWCISRQLWWGHRIPVWYCGECGGLTVAVDDPAACRHCGSRRIEQDPDVLDTWFSSALWPHSTLGWPEDTADFRYFYPTSVMETAYDILFFWVARMIMMGIEDTGRVPFRTVYLHGLIRDEKGEKMSKTRGNVLNPLDTLEEYGTDALRFALTTGTAPGNDSKLSADRLEASRNFANKLWNAARFVMRSLRATAGGESRGGEPALEDRWILSRLNQTVAAVNRLMEEFQFGEAQRQIYDFLWGEYCDWYIELSKIRLSRGGQPSPLPVLVRVLETSLRLLHPYMPFVTEELWQQLRSGSGGAESIMVAPYPAADSRADDPAAERTMAAVIDIIRAIRNIRAQYRLGPQRPVAARVYAGGLTADLEPYAGAVRLLARAEPFTFLKKRPEAPAGDDTLVLLLKDAELLITLDAVDLEAEKARLAGEIEQTRAQLARLKTRLEDEAFVSRAPAAVVEKERQKLRELAEKLDRLTGQGNQA